MILINDTKKPAYKRVQFSDLEYGDVFEDINGKVWVRTRNFTSSGPNYNSICLEDISPLHFHDLDIVYPLNAILHYERILEIKE